MVPSGRKHSGKLAKPSVGDQAIRAYEFEQEDKKDLSGSEEDAIEGTVNLTFTDHVLHFHVFHVSVWGLVKLL